VLSLTIKYADFLNDFISIIKTMTIKTLKLCNFCYYF